MNIPIDTVLGAAATVSGAAASASGAAAGATAARWTRRSRAAEASGRDWRTLPGGRDRTRILEFLTFFYIGGTERQVMNLAMGLDPENYDVHLGCLGKTGPLLEEAVARGLPVSEFKIQNLCGVDSWRARAAFVAHLRERRIQVVHSYGFYSNLFAVPAAFLAGVPVVIAAIRDCGETLTPMQKLAQKLCCSRADCILVNAEGVRSWLLSGGYPAQKIKVIRNGIVSSQSVSIAEGRRVRSEGNPGKLRGELGLAADTPLVAVISRLNPMKGLEYFLEAVAILSRKFPEARFLILGGPDQKNCGSYEADLQTYAASLGLGGRVIFTGFRTDIRQILPEIDISVLPSLSEGLSNSLLESMAAGVPVVATRVGGTPEAVEDGESGLLVPPSDSGALIQAITRLLEDRDFARRLGLAGKSRVQAQFSIERMVQETAELYGELLAAKHKPAQERQVAET